MRNAFRRRERWRASRVGEEGVLPVELVTYAQVGHLHQAGRSAQQIGRFDITVDDFLVVNWEKKEEQDLILEHLNSRTNKKRRKESVNTICFYLHFRSTKHIKRLFHRTHEKGKRKNGKVNLSERKKKKSFSIFFLFLGKLQQGRRERRQRAISVSNIGDGIIFLLIFLSLTVFHSHEDVPERQPGLLLVHRGLGGNLEHLSTFQQLENWKEKTAIF